MSQLKKRSLSQKHHGVFDRTPRISNILPIDDQEKENDPIIDDLAKLEVSRQLFKNGSSRTSLEINDNAQPLKPCNSRRELIQTWTDSVNSSNSRLKSSPLFGSRIRDSFKGTIKSSPSCQVHTPDLGKTRSEGLTKQKFKAACMNLIPGLKKVNRSPGHGFTSPTPKDNQNDNYEGPTIFHESCYKASSLQQIQSCYSQVAKDDRGQEDSDGQSPLDLLLQNESLAKSVDLRTDSFGNTMFDKHQILEIATFALTIYDEMSCDISWNIFKTWIEKVEYEERSKYEPENHWFSLIAKLQQRHPRNNSDCNESDNQNDESLDEGNDEGNDEGINIKTATSFDYPEANLVALPLQVQFSLQLLTCMKDELNRWCELQKRVQNIGLRSPRPNPIETANLESKSRNNFLRRKRQSMDSDKSDDNTVSSSFHDQFQRSPQALMDELVQSFASIPNLMKTLVMIDEDKMRTNTFDFDIIKKAMLLKQSIEGAWLGEMLQHHQRKRATEYLFLLSKLSTEEARQAELNGDEKMNQQLRELFQTIGDLEGFLPSMLAVDKHEIEDLATTPMITQVLDEMITMPFASTLFFFDFFLLGLLIFSFRRCVDTYLQRQESKTVLSWLYLTLCSAFYFQMRAIGRVVSLFAMTRNTLFRNAILFNIWTLLYIGCNIFVIWCIITIRFNAPKGKDEYLMNEGVRMQFAITTMLLWSNLLGLVKSMNAKLATFVSAIGQIVKDVCWYGILIIGMVLCFSQVFYTLLVPSDCLAESNNIKDCMPGEYYLITYSVLLGELDDDLIRGIEDRFLALALFFGFSFIMAIVMLNILIAVISDSYEKSLLRSPKLFGLARVHQLAEILALQDLFRVRSGNRLSNQCFKWTSIQWTKGGFTFFVITACIYCMWIIIDLWADASNLGLIQIMVNISNLVIFGIFILLLAGDAQIIESSVKINNCFVKIIHEKIHSLMLRVLGKSQTDSILHDQWSGRLIYIKKEIETSTRKIQCSLQNFHKEVRYIDYEQKELKQEISHKLHKLEKEIAHLVGIRTKTDDAEEMNKLFTI